MTPRLEESPSRLFALVYLLAALLAAAHAGWHYLMGHYEYILLPSVGALLLLGAAVVRLADHRAQHMASYVLISTGYLLLAVELIRLDQTADLWLGLPPVVALLLLPLGPALMLNLLLVPLWLLLMDLQMSLEHAALSYLALVVLCTLAPWEQLRQHALLRATDPSDPHCEALTASALEETLQSELARAQTLERRLSVLVIHLPQLDMAGEQFGPRLYRDMLHRFCEVAHHTCRSHDSLGRAEGNLFWLVLPDTGENGALMVRNRLLAALERCVLAETGPLTARIAVCTPQPGERWLAFEQRLLRRGQALTESTS
ncbi:diguanylate cyclase [Franzmannia pantelleriensis]|uniref:Diguanylate cyclase n=1 Tax=Franzmannia pantelleriensis TaxID=48727 RepID=A0A1G9VIZ2_9GAMM|nr:diguanylate cyclase [Halomonas pantelleriensis]SDM72129.1 diguanylate cyclase [Halomonas pantelleriensis]